MTDTEKTTQQVALRLPADLVIAIDERAKSVGLSRNEWIVKATTWVIHCLPTRADADVAHTAALAAPDDVKGHERVDMGLGNPDGKGPKRT